jgi:hypothetical protein
VRNTYRLSAISLLLAFMIQATHAFRMPLQAESQTKIDEILRITGAYCDRLDGAALDFVCVEEITEKFNFFLDIQRILNRAPSGGRFRIPKEKAERTSLYDFQVVRKNNRMEEKRTLLEKEGEKTYIPGAELQTINFVYKNVLFAPVGILSPPLQPHFSYKIIGQEMTTGEKCWILEAVPKPHFKTELLYGRVWVRERDYSIAKIIWNQENVGNFHIFSQRGITYMAEPKITLISEFEMENNGIMFPSNFSIEEAYIKKGRTYVRSQTIVHYKDFRFFTVEVEIK